MRLVVTSSSGIWVSSELAASRMRATVRRLRSWAGWRRFAAIDALIRESMRGWLDMTRVGRMRRVPRVSRFRDPGSPSSITCTVCSQSQHEGTLREPLIKSGSLKGTAFRPSVNARYKAGALVPEECPRDLIRLSLGRSRQCELHVRRQAERDEIIRGIEVVLSRFVDNAHQAVPGGGRIPNHGIQLSPFERRRVAFVANAKDEGLAFSLLARRAV